jgi:hypothetical protein
MPALGSAHADSAGHTCVASIGGRHAESDPGARPLVRSGARPRMAPNVQMSERECAPRGPTRPCRYGAPSGRIRLMFGVSVRARRTGARRALRRRRRRSSRDLQLPAPEVHAGLASHPNPQPRAQRRRQRLYHRPRTVDRPCRSGRTRRALCRTRRWRATSSTSTSGDRSGAGRVRRRTADRSTRQRPPQAAAGR